MLNLKKLEKSSVIYLELLHIEETLVWNLPNLPSYFPYNCVYSFAIQSWKTWCQTFWKCVFLLQQQQKPSKKVLKKIVNSVPSTLFAGTIFPAGLFSSKWPPLNIWVVTFFRLCSRSVKSCCWAWISYDLLKSLKKRFEIISIFSRPTLNCGCRESAASVRMTAYIKIFWTDNSERSVTFCNSLLKRSGLVLIINSFMQETTQMWYWLIRLD